MRPRLIPLALLGASTLGCTSLGKRDDFIGCTDPDELIRQSVRAPRLAVGGNRTCEVVEDGLECWGDVDASLVYYLRELSEIESIRSTGTRTCMLTRAGTLWCRSDSPSWPIERAFTDVVDFDLTDNEICVVQNSGPVRCRGRSTYRVPGTSKAVAVALGSFGCAWSAEGEVWCWRGRGRARRLPAVEHAIDIEIRYDDVWIVERSGAVLHAPSARHVRRVAGIDDAVDVEASIGSVCARRLNGKVSCWRTSPSTVKSSLFGHAEQPEPLEPREMPNIDDAVDLAVGPTHACVKQRDGQVRCWGEGQRWLWYPAQIDGIPPAVEVRVGERHACAIDRSGALWCWGVPRGYSSDLRDIGPHRIHDAVTRMRLQGSATCAELATGDWRCWGMPHDGMVGVPTWPTSSLAIGKDHTCVLLADQTTQCWGSNTTGQLGWEPDQVRHFLEPVVIPGLPPLTSIIAGESHTCGLDSAGLAWCWGRYRSGESIHLPPATDVAPASVPNTPAFRSLAAGGRHGCGVDFTGEVWCWWPGIAPQRIDGFENITQLDAHGETTCGVDQFGAVLCLGENSSRQANPGSSDGSLGPAEVASRRRVRVIEPTRRDRWADPQYYLSGVPR